jgi:hypothetical protein
VARVSSDPAAASGNAAGEQLERNFASDSDRESGYLRLNGHVRFTPESGHTPLGGGVSVESCNAT